LLPFEDSCWALTRQLFRVAAALTLLVTITSIGALRAQELAGQRPQDIQESASRLLDGFARYTLRDYARAREILEPLAQQGNADAQQLVGSMYANGEGVAQDKARAAYWFSLAAEQRNVDAQFALGIMYRDGASVPKDRGLAMAWLRRAAEGQHSEACNALGELYMGAATSAERQDATIWFERAALMGNGTAQYNLGVLYALGRGVEQSDVEAYKWFELSAAFSLGPQRDSAHRALVAMRERMMPAQVEIANLLTRDWVSRSR
jgi:TPR repeat protein